MDAFFFSHIVPILSWILIGAGTFFLLTSSIGILRMPDVFTRLHAAGVGDALGCPLVLIGLLLQYGFTLISLKVFLLILFLLITGPASCHALAKAAMLTEKPKGDQTLSTKEKRL